MITEEHLRHWVGEILYQLNGIKQEIAADKVKVIGVNLSKDESVYVSFEYLQEKENTIRGTLNCILFDIEHDKEPKE